MSALAFDTRRGVAVLYGGIQGSVGRSSGTRYGDTWEWDGTTWAERNVDTPGPRDHHALAYDEAHGLTVLYGGSAYDRSYPHETWGWDGARWRVIDSLTGPGGLVHHAMAYDSRRRRIVLFGGQRPRAGDRPGVAANSDTWEWDGTRWERRATERERVVLFGGGGPGGPGLYNAFADVWEWDGARWIRRTP